MNDTDKNRLEQVEAIVSDEKEWADVCPSTHTCIAKGDIRFLISHLKDAMERESKLRDLHLVALDEHSETNPYCDECGNKWPCSTIAILDGGEG